MGLGASRRSRRGARSIARQNDEIIASIQKRAADRGTELTESEKRRIRERTQESTEQQQTIGTFGKWSGYFQTAEYTIPKTNDIKIIVSNLAEAPIGGDLASILGAGRDGGDFHPPNMDDEEWDRTKKASDDAERALRDIKTWKSIGTSSLSCGIVFGVAAFLFRRRDF